LDLGLKKRYFFFFFAAFFAGLAFFLVAMFVFSLSIRDGTLRHQIIAICSLYRVNQKNSQEKNAHGLEPCDKAMAWRHRFLHAMFAASLCKRNNRDFTTCSQTA
jgi:hypothetical protein